MSYRREKPSSSSAEYLPMLTLLWALFLFILPRLVNSLDGRVDHLSCIWAAWWQCWRLLSLWGAGPPALRLPVVLQLTASSPGRAWPGQVYPGRRTRAASPQERSLEVLSGLSAGRYHAELMLLTPETAWAFPHLAACLVVCLLHHTICSRMLLCTLMLTLIAWCYIIFPFWLLPSCL